MRKERTSNNLSLPYIKRRDAKNEKKGSRVPEVRQHGIQE